MNRDRKLSTAYAVRDSLFAHSLAMLGDGVWVLVGPARKANQVDPDACAKAIREVFSYVSSESVDPMRKDLFAPILNSSGISTVKGFMQVAKCVEIECFEGIITLIPTKNMGVAGGFAPLAPMTFVDADDKELWSQLCLAFDLCV